VIAFAQELGKSTRVSLLKKTLEEEKETDEKPPDSPDINAHANQGEESGRRRDFADKKQVSQRGISAMSRVFLKNAVPGNSARNGVIFLAGVKQT
jgi:hypothetical protein